MIETIINDPFALPSNARPITFDETDIKVSPSVLIISSCL